MNQNKKVLNQVKQEIDQPKRLIRIREVIQLTGISKSYIYQLVSQNLFPKSIQLIKGGSSVAWVEGEVVDWIDERIQERNTEVCNTEISKSEIERKSLLLGKMKFKEFREFIESNDDVEVMEFKEYMESIDDIEAMDDMGLLDAWESLGLIEAIDESSRNSVITKP